ncbi:ATP-binding protein [Streptomyces hoynatensis]|uniref:ATP-binding protein n=1 Tax=Streptomyces hoynatensis TaxID=1141874 RepID=UPI001F4D68F1|nr:tetratricopeptide repeat protein [Streptomyces hoynatensis]
MCVISGTAGAGKTSLALHWAHQVEANFPGGQLYVNLRGYDPGEPVRAQEALHHFLTALGVPANAVPQDTESAAALFRSLVAGRKMLVVLDNAASAGQVRPLLPGHPGCLVIVTSRGRLSGLAIRDGAHHLTLGTLPEAEAVALLRAVTAGFRPEDDGGKLAELARLCAHLPLALRIAAERAAARPHLRLDTLIADLRDESALWEALSTGDEQDAEAVRTVFAWSYRALSPDTARLFRLLGLHPGPGFGIAAAAALAALSPRRARQLLDSLVSAHLLEQTAPDRFEFHDLLRAYATDQARLEESVGEREAALRRLCDWYARTADAAQRWITPARARVPLDPPPEGAVAGDFADYDQAVDWSEREHGNVLAAVRAAEKAGLDGYAWRLAAIFFNAQAPSAPVAEWLAAGEAGLRAARRVGDPAAQAGLLDNLGFARRRLNDLTGALRSHEEALHIRRRLGDRRGEAAARNALGLVLLRLRRFDEAEEDFVSAASTFREIGAEHWEAVSHVNLAEARLEAGRLDGVAEHLDRAGRLHRRMRNPRSLGNVLRVRSALHLRRGELPQALRAAEEAVELALDLRNRVLEGHVLLSLGHALAASGRYADALASYRRAGVIHRALGDRSREALAWRGTGETCRALGREEEAADFCRMAATVHGQLGEPWNQALALAALAAILRERDPAAAARFRAEGLRLVARFGDAAARAMRERLAAEGERER